MSSRMRIGITHGDINSISYEVIMKALLDPRILEDCTPILYGSSKVAAYHRKTLNINNLSFNAIRTADEASPRKANLINCINDEVRVELGKSTPQAGEAAFLALKKAVEDLKAGKIDALVTGPINKHNIQSEQFSFPGHTEYLAREFGAEDVLMFMVGETMRVGVVTGHVPLAEVAKLITIDKILQKIHLMNQSLREDFAIPRPRIAVLGLNPHASDQGIIGREDMDVVQPAVQKAKEEGILAFGPFPSDGFFGSGSFKKFDGILAMYHDQGLIPFKALTYEGGVNFTAGLPVVRTSPAHGTAYELAGKNEANENSFRQALYLACDVVKNRLLFKEISTNPLKHYELNDSSQAAS
ncbi:MAG: 4-hydroxythreonine-4-phosphate dehydrogenase PdxA [Bacteroidales bacterium]